MIYLQSIRRQFYSTIVCDISTYIPLSSTNKTDGHDVPGISSGTPPTYTSKSDRYDIPDISTGTPLSSTNKTDRHDVPGISADNSLSSTNESDISDISTSNQRIYECTYLSTKDWATHRIHRWWILGAP